MIETAITNLLSKQANYTELDREKIRFGVRILLSECYKLLIIYGIAYLLGCTLPTLIVHASFLLLRQVALGAHFQSVISCLIWSTLSFPIMAALLHTWTFPAKSVWGIGFICMLLILWKAPVETAKQPVVNKQHRQFLRKKVYFRLAIVSIIFCLVPLAIQQLIVWGIVILTICLYIQLFKGGSTI